MMTNDFYYVISYNGLNCVPSKFICWSLNLSTSEKCDLIWTSDCGRCNLLRWGHTRIRLVPNPMWYPYRCRRVYQPTPVFLPGESHGQRSLVSYSPWGCTESTEATAQYSTAHPYRNGKFGWRHVYGLGGGGCVLCWFSGKESAWSTGDAGSVLGSGRSPGGGHGNPL